MCDEVNLVDGQFYEGNRILSSILRDAQTLAGFLNINYVRNYLPFK